MEHSQNDFRKHVILYALGIALVVAAVFSPVRSFSFLNLDDNEYVTENPHVVSGLTRQNVVWAFTNFRAGHWHPLAWVSHMIDVQLFGLNPGPHHLTNLLLHTLNVVLLFLFLARATGAVRVSCCVALIFGLHPMRLESVAWVTERKDVLSIFFGLAALNLYLQFVRTRSVLWYSLCICCFILSLLSKPTLVPFPLLLFLVDIWPLERMQLSDLSSWAKIRTPLFEKLPMLVISLGSSIVTVRAQDAEGALKSLSDYTLSARCANALTSYLAYAGKLFLPTGMGIFYPFQTYAPGVGAGAFLGLVAVTYICVTVRTRHPYLLVGWLWFLLAALPMIGFVQFGGQAFGDRWTYFPHVGLLFGVTWWVCDKLQNRPSALKLAAGMSVALCAVVTTTNLPYWQSSKAILTHTLEVAPDNFMALNNLGVTFDEAGDLASAKPLFERTVQLRPAYAEGLNNLGTVYAREGKTAAAKELFERAVQAESGLLAARYHLGLVKHDSGDTAGAVLDWLRVLSSDPTFQRARESLMFAVNRLQAQGCPPNSLSSSEMHEMANRINALPPSEMRSGLIQFSGCYGING
ncbi:MAG: tetratricopeptide repeat protein [Bdellovibrionota bacterium]